MSRSLSFLLFILTKHQIYVNIVAHSDDRLDANQGGKSERSLRRSRRRQVVGNTHWSQDPRCEQKRLFSKGKRKQTSDFWEIKNDCLTLDGGNKLRDETAKS